MKGVIKLHMANLTLKTIFELTDLNLKDLKGAKSCTEKTYFSRIKKKIKECTEWMNYYSVRASDYKSLSRDDFIDKYHMVYHQDEYETDIIESNDRVDYYTKEINKLEEILAESMPVDKWVLWFAFDFEVTKVFGADAKKLYELLSDKKNHNIRGELESGGGCYTIVSWKEF